MFVGEDDGRNPVAGLEAAFAATIAAEPLEQKLRAASKDADAAALGHEVQLAVTRGVITRAEAAVIERARTLRRRAIMVDDFPRDLGKTEIYQTTEPVFANELQKGGAL